MRKILIAAGAAAAVTTIGVLTYRYVRRRQLAAEPADETEPTDVFVVDAIIIDVPPVDVIP